MGEYECYLLGWTSCKLWRYGLVELTPGRWEPKTFLPHTILSPYFFTELTDKYISENGPSKKSRIYLDVSKHVENYYECRLRSFDGQTTTAKASNDAPASSSGDYNIYNLMHHIKCLWKKIVKKNLAKKQILKL